MLILYIIHITSNYFELWDTEGDDVQKIYSLSNYQMYTTPSLPYSSHGSGVNSINLPVLRLEFLKITYSYFIVKPCCIFGMSFQKFQMTVRLKANQDYDRMGPPIKADLAETLLTIFLPCVSPLSLSHFVKLVARIIFSWAAAHVRAMWFLVGKVMGVSVDIAVRSAEIARSNL